MQIFYAVFCVLGTILPLSQFIPWLADHGLDIALLLQHILASPISAFAWLDVLVSGVALIAFVLVEGRRIRMPRQRHLAQGGAVTAS